ncbi:glycosyltransferase [Mesorhizobium sp. BAC0120]|uniref:glycosyltransferase n=1 Tax=Mesorhizobium sp. BAC0120 TaxID=3090670 RepID=UPI00298D4A16|nr:glycosyltransferase [Mesorhizobium sp. BAC0120]MDW6023074.1 glycosyltransferase [Mesorhizobium sp. BAC0120]
MLIVTNTERFPPAWSSSGVTGNTVHAGSAKEFFRHRGAGTVWMVDCHPPLLQELVLATLFWKDRPPIITFDLVLREPMRLQDRLLLPIKKSILARVDHHIHVFRDLGGYERVFGIGPDRSSFVPFKVNLTERHALSANPEGSYVLCFGRSLRDFDTFFDAVEQLPFPAAIARPNPSELRAHGARFSRSLDLLPKNVEILDDDGTEAAQIRLLGDAKLVVLPILKHSIAASGISICLNAMALGKCVIASEGPGVSDLFATEVLTFPPENAAALRNLIRRTWEDDQLRLRTAEAGRQYASWVGGETELYNRIIDCIVRWQLSRPQQPTYDSLRN